MLSDVIAFYKYYVGARIIQFGDLFRIDPPPPLLSPPLPRQVVGVLSQDGVVRFIHVHRCVLLFEVGRLDDRVTSFCVSPTGHHLVTVMDSGGLNLYSVQALSSQHNKVSPTGHHLVTVIDSGGLNLYSVQAVSSQHNKVRSRHCPVSITR